MKAAILGPSQRDDIFVIKLAQTTLHCPAMRSNKPMDKAKWLAVYSRHVIPAESFLRPLAPPLTSFPRHND
jgi:hypothetical protein